MATKVKDINWLSVSSLVLGIGSLLGAWKGSMVWVVACGFVSLSYAMLSALERF